MRLLYPRPPIDLLGVSLEQLLQRIPPLGWHGIDCANGQVVAEGARVMVVVERVRAFPQGVEINLGFATGDPEVTRHVQAKESLDEVMERVRPRRPEPLPPGEFRVSNQVKFVPLTIQQLHPQRNPELHPVVTVVAESEELQVHHVSTTEMVADDECAAFEATRAMHMPPGALMALWVRPLDKLPRELRCDVSWPGEGLLGSAAIDLDEAKAAARHARRLYEVEFTAAG